MFWFGKKRPDESKRLQDNAEATSDGEAEMNGDYERAKLQLLVVISSLPNPTSKDGAITFRCIVKALVHVLHMRPFVSVSVVGQLLPGTLNAYSALHPEMGLGTIDTTTALRLFSQCEDSAREADAGALHAEQNREKAGKEQETTEAHESDIIQEEANEEANLDSSSRWEADTLDTEIGGGNDASAMAMDLEPLDEKRLSYELDRLFDEARRYRNCEEYQKMLEFVAKTKWLGAYNATLVETQLPTARYALSAWEWKKKGWRPRHMARPLVILNHRPVGFVFDVSEIEEDPKWIASSRPTKDDIYKDAINQLAHPFVAEGKIREEFFEGVCRAMAWHGVYYEPVDAAGSRYAGDIRIEDREEPKLTLMYRKRLYRWRAGFVITVVNSQDLATRFATLCHELGHLFCNHLPCPLHWTASRTTHSQEAAEESRKTKTCWENRDLSETVKEIEAEAVSYLVCMRLGLKASSPNYLSNHVKDIVPREVSTEKIMRAVDMIERLYKAMDKETARPEAITDCWLYRYDSTFREAYKAWGRAERIPTRVRNMLANQGMQFPL